MAKKSPLRAVKPGEGPPRRKSVTEAADDGTRLELLVSLRTRVAATVGDPNCPPRDLAALSRRLLEIAKEIEAIEAEDRGDDVGDAAATPDEEWAAT